MNDISPVILCRGCGGDIEHPYDLYQRADSDDGTTFTITYWCRRCYEKEES